MKTAGFSLIEVLVATAVVAAGAAALAPLFIVSARTGRMAQATSMTLLLAQQKIEELRADSRNSIPSPPSALSGNTPGYFDYIDRIGRPVRAGDASTPPPAAVYVRRWAIEPLGGVSAGDAVVLKILVVHRGSHAGDGSNVTRAPGEARLVTVKTKKAG